MCISIIIYFLTCAQQTWNFVFNSEEIYWIRIWKWPNLRLMIVRTWMPFQSPPMPALNYPMWSISTLACQGCSVPLPPTPCIGPISSNMYITIFSRRRQSSNYLIVSRILQFFNNSKMFLRKTWILTNYYIRPFWVLALQSLKDLYVLILGSGFR
jgi:hypothetical protein